MSEYLPGRIEIGGHLPRRHLARFCRAFGATAETALAGHVETERLVSEDSEAPWGAFEELETLCREIGLAYIRHSEGRFEFSPEVVFWAPGMPGPVSVLTDHEENPHVDMTVLAAIRHALTDGDTETALRLAEDAVVELPVLPPFRIEEHTHEKANSCGASLHRPVT